MFKVDRNRMKFLNRYEKHQKDMKQTFRKLIRSYDQFIELIDDIENHPDVTPTEVQQVKNRLNTLVDRIRDIGSNKIQKVNSSNG